MKSHLLIIFLLSIISKSLIAQKDPVVTSNFIEGRIFDSKTHEPLPFVLIYLKENKQKVIAQTDMDGKFKLIIPSGDLKEKMLLETSYVGYDSIQVTIKKKKLPVKRLELKLQESKNLLHEVY